MPDFSHVIMEDQDWCISMQIPNLHHESSADCERGRVVPFLKRRVRVACVLVRFIITVQWEVNSLRWGTKWDGAIVWLNFRISCKAPDLGLGDSVEIPTEVVISHVGEIMVMRPSVRPSLTRDPVDSGVCFSCIIATWCRPLLAANLPWFFFRANISKYGEDCQTKRRTPFHCLRLISELKQGLRGEWILW